MVQLALVPGALRVEAQLRLLLRETRACEFGVLEHAEEPSLVDGPLAGRRRFGCSCERNLRSSFVPSPASSRLPTQYATNISSSRASVAYVAGTGADAVGPCADDIVRLRSVHPRLFAKSLVFGEAHAAVPIEVHVVE